MVELNDENPDIEAGGCLGTAGSYGSLGTATGCAGTFGTLGTYGCLTASIEDGMVDSVSTN